MKHGLLSRDVLLPYEDEAALEEMSERVRSELQPVGEMELLLVERIIAAAWRLRRLGRVEAGIFIWVRAEQEEAIAKANRMDEILGDPWAMPTTTDKQKPQEALSEAEEMQAKQEAETSALGRTFIRDSNSANAFSKLSRYEAAIERSLYKALHELQRLQAARGAQSHVEPPPAIDVDVSGLS